MTNPVLRQRLFVGNDKATWHRRWKVLISAIVGYALDGTDMLILSFGMVAIMSEFNVSLADGGWIATYTLIGAVLGGYIFGILADYIGRVKTFRCTIIIFSVFTGLCAIASNVFELSLYRFIAGLGLGGEYGIAMTLVAETWPAEKRARATAGVAVGWQLGVALAAILSALVMPVYGWRGMFAVAMLPGLVAAGLRWSLPEPDIWIERNEAKKAMKAKLAAGATLSEEERKSLSNMSKFPLTHLFASPKKTLITFALTVMTSIQNFGYYGIMVWLPTILMQKHNLSLTKTTGWMVVTIIGMMLGISIFGYFADRVGRRPMYIVFYFCSAAAIWGYSSISDPIYLLFGGAIMGFFCNGMMAGYGALISENYTTDARSTAQNFIFNTGRAVGGFAPVIIGLLAARFTLSGALAMLAIIYIVGAINVFFLVPETRGTQLK